MKANIYISFFLFSISGYAQQEWGLVKTIPIEEQVSSFSIDPEGRIYLGSRFGNLQRLKPNGEKDEYFSGIANSEISFIEAWNKFKVFLFFRDLQKFSLLDRFNTTPIEYDLSAFNIEYAWLAAPGIDNSIWILSTDFNELRKYNIQTKQLIFNTPLSIDVNQATHIRAYQNLLIISDESKGFYIFDLFGNLLRTIEAKGIRYFQILDGKIIYLQNEEVKSLDPFNLITAKQIKAPKGAFEGVLISGENYFFIKGSEIKIYRMKM